MQPAEPTENSIQSPLLKLYGLVALVVGVVILAATILSIYNLHQAEMRVESETRNLSNSLTLTFDGMIDTIDLALLSCADEIASELDQGKPDRRKIDTYLKKQRERVPSLVSLRASDDRGNLLYGLENVQQAAPISDREYFTNLKMDYDAGLFISRPIISRIKNQWIWLFSRPIIKKDGSFGGIVTGSVLTEEIDRKLSNISMPPDSSISLRHQSMDLIARASYGHANVIPIGSNKLSDTLINALKHNPLEGTYISDTSGIDPVIKTYSYVASKKYGFLVISAISREVALAAWKKQVEVISLLIVVFAAGAMVFVFFIRAALLRQSQDMKTIQSSRDALQSLNRELEQRVETRTAELSDTLEHLRITQNDLVQSEKLASLGAIVVGISHEINTPIGNAITLTSLLAQQFDELAALIGAGKVSRSALENWVKFAVETNTLVDRSVNRVAALISSFKQLSIDETSERLRTFDLHDVIDDMVTMMRPNLHNFPLVFVNEIPPGITCESYVGSLEEIISNLVNNARLHAFEKELPGQICFSAVIENEKIKLSISDNGIGLDSDTLSHIFDPFFTTKLGKGGSGLGLTVCRRIANHILQGELIATSIPGQGCRFILTMPKKIISKV